MSAKGQQPKQRLQKYLANRGIASRRTIESWIEQGIIKVDGRVAKVGEHVNDDSRISINGKPLRSKPIDHKTRVLVYNKPEGEICTRRDPEKRPTVFRNLPKLKGQRWVIVGRLDINSRGLLLFTNDGQLANKLMHPRSELEREYLCRVFGQVTPEMIEQLLNGIEMDGQIVRFHSVKYYRGEGQNHWYSVVVKEGKYREVRRMWDAVGGKVNRLIRTRYGAMTMPQSLKMGHYVELTDAEIRKLWPRNKSVEGEEVEEAPQITLSTKKQQTERKRKRKPKK